jgi:hypothetical protein
MFRTTNGSSDAYSDTPPKRRRQGRGLGPFTSGHLTIIVVALVIAVAFPFAAFAVTGSNVFVTDATSGTRAAVDSGNHLKVGDGSGPLTVDGTVGVGGIPKESTYFRFGPVDVTPTSGCRVSTPPLPSGKALIVTMLHVDIFQAPASPGVGNFLAAYADTSCTKIIDDFNPSAIGISPLPFVPGIATTTGVSMKSFGGEVKAEVEIVGYLVAASAVPSGT